MRLNKKFLANISVVSVCALLWIWALPNTIALRHVLLGIGCIAGLLQIKENWHLLRQFKLILIPLYLVAILFVWVGLHYFFFSLNPVLELSEIKGLWLRTFTGFIMAVGFAISLSQNPSLCKYFYISIFSVPLINVGAYLYASFLKGALIAPNDFVFFLFAKIETAYFGALAASVAVAKVIYILISADIKNSKGKSLMYLMGLSLVLVSALISSTKNGIAIAMGLTALLVLAIILNILFNRKTSKLFSLGALIFIVVATAYVWHNHQALASRGWSTIFHDAQVAIDVDTNKQWQNGAYHTLPINESGQALAINTYERFSWATVGLRLIKEYPLGYGSINRSFVGLMDVAQIPHVHQGQVHSGWIDFGLAYGIPGLVCLLGSLFLSMCLVLRNQTQLGMIALIISLALLPFCLIAEMSYKQYFESLVFFITFIATIVAIGKVPKA